MNRRIVATASLGLVGASWIVMGATSHFGGAHTIVSGAFTAACALLYVGRSAISQVIARAAAWAVIVPYAFIGWLLWSHGLHLQWSHLALPALAGVSLVAARPLLHTERARATFAPIAMRSWFLAAATAAVGIGIAVTLLAVEVAFVHQTASALLLGALAASLVGSGLGIVRMRGWGVLLGAISAVLGVAVAFMNHRLFGWSPLLLAAPGLLTTAALIAARAGIGHEPEGEPAPSFAKIRVAPIASEEASDGLEADDTLVPDRAIERHATAR